MLNIQIVGCNYEVRVLKDYEAFELLKVEIYLGAGRLKEMFISYEEMETYREAYDKGLQ